MENFNISPLNSNSLCEIVRVVNEDYYSDDNSDPDFALQQAMFLDKIRNNIPNLREKITSIGGFDNVLNRCLQLFGGYENSEVAILHTLMFELAMAQIDIPFTQHVNKNISYKICFMIGTTEGEFLINYDDFEPLIPQLKFDVANLEKLKSVNSPREYEGIIFNDINNVFIDS